MLFFSGQRADRGPCCLMPRWACLLGLLEGYINTRQAVRRTDDLSWSPVVGCWGGTTSSPSTRAGDAKTGARH
jgi:hypothetical protein